MPRAEVLSGIRARRFRRAFAAYLFGCAVRKRRYPLFIFGGRDGFRRTVRDLRKLGLCKPVRFDGRVFFGLSMPHWPSAAFDRAVAGGALNLAAAGTPRKQYIDSAVLAITRRCSYGCLHCYERLNIGAEEVVPVEKWREVIAGLQKLGIGVITLSGGEPLDRFDDVLSLLRSADASKSDFHLHTSGFGLTPERAKALRAAGLVAAGVGLDDGVPARHDALRGKTGAFETALQAIRFFQDAGIFAYVNVCLTKELSAPGELERFYERLKSEGVGLVRLLEPKPCGGYFDEDPDRLFDVGDRARCAAFYERTAWDPAYRDYPSVFYESYLETPERMGCRLAGHSLFYIDSLGHVEPCVFLPVSFGNIMREDVAAVFEKMRRAAPQPFRGGCPAVLLAPEMRARYSRGQQVPVPYEDIRPSWEKMWETGGRA